MKEFQIKFTGEVLQAIDQICKLTTVKNRGEAVRDAIYIYKTCFAVAKGKEVVIKQENSNKGKILTIPYKKKYL